MSFTTDVATELCSLQVKKTCCRRAAALGLFLGARKNESGGYTSYYYEKAVADMAADMLKRIFRSDAELNETVRVGRRTYMLTFECQGVSDFLNTVDGDSREELPHELAGFRCAGCQGAFLRGAFLGCGSVTDPQKSYHLELTFPDEKRADLVSRLMKNVIGQPNRINRGERFALYYKNNGAILDFLYYVGCNRSSLYMANSFIKRDIRNNENRATNCVARNISLSVKAAQKQIGAIERLMETGKLDTLPEELRYTARLRVENEAASLAELALMHEPPISKSGLNRRLSRLVEAAEDCKT